MFFKKWVKNSISTKAKISFLLKNPESLSYLEVDLDHALYIQFLSRYRDTGKYETKDYFYCSPSLSLIYQRTDSALWVSGEVHITNEGKGG